MKFEATDATTFVSFVGKVLTLAEIDEIYEYESELQGEIEEIEGSRVVLKYSTWHGTENSVVQDSNTLENIVSEMPIKSINSIRLKREPLEKAFVEAWGQINKGNQLLKFLFDRNQSNRGDYYPTNVEQEVAVTVIQWLGSPVGQGFLGDVLEKWCLQDEVKK